jgi:rubrerythrin
MAENLVGFLENQIKLEHNIVNSVEDAVSKIENAAVSTALRGIALDSRKHAMMYNSAIALLTLSSTALNEEQLDLQKEVIQKHIEMEAAVIKQLNLMLPSVKNEKVNLLLKAILSDEKRHHQLLKNLLEILVRGETVTEGDWWDAIWGDVPGLWT